MSELVLMSSEIPASYIRFATIKSPTSPVSADKLILAPNWTNPSHENRPCVWVNSQQMRQKTTLGSEFSETDIATEPVNGVKINFRQSDCAQKYLVFLLK